MSLNRGVGFPICKIIVAGKYAGQELKLDGEDYVIVKMADILAVVE